MHFYFLKYNVCNDNKLWCYYVIGCLMCQKSCKSLSSSCCCCDYDNIFGVKGTRWLKSLKLSDNDQILLHEHVMQIEFLNTEIKNIESKITCEASKNESVKILMSMTGI